jgi:hypothetical protein
VRAAGGRPATDGRSRPAEVELDCKADMIVPDDTVGIDCEQGVIIHEGRECRFATLRCPQKSSRSSATAVSSRTWRRPYLWPRRGRYPVPAAETLRQRRPDSLSCQSEASPTFSSGRSRRAGTFDTASGPSPLASRQRRRTHPAREEDSGKGLGLHPQPRLGWCMPESRPLCFQNLPPCLG